MSGWYWFALAGVYVALLLLGLALARIAKRVESQRDEHLARLQRARRAEDGNVVDRG